MLFRSINKKTSTQGTVSGTTWLNAKQRASIKVEYVHGTGPASMHLSWSSPAAQSPGALRIVPSDSLVTSN